MLCVCVCVCQNVFKYNLSLPRALLNLNGDMNVCRANTIYLPDIASEVRCPPSTSVTSTSLHNLNGGNALVTTTCPGDGKGKLESVISLPQVCACHFSLLVQPATIVSVHVVHPFTGIFRLPLVTNLCACSRHHSSIWLQLQYKYITYMYHMSLYNRKGVVFVCVCARNRVCARARRERNIISLI